MNDLIRLRVRIRARPASRCSADRRPAAYAKPNGGRCHEQQSPGRVPSRAAPATLLYNTSNLNLPPPLSQRSRQRLGRAKFQRIASLVRWADGPRTVFQCARGSSMSRSSGPNLVLRAGRDQPPAAERCSRVIAMASLAAACPAISQRASKMPISAPTWSQSLALIPVHATGPARHLRGNRPIAELCGSKPFPTSFRAMQRRRLAGDGADGRAVRVGA